MYVFWNKFLTFLARDTFFKAISGLAIYWCLMEQFPVYPEGDILFHMSPLRINIYKGWWRWWDRDLFYWYFNLRECSYWVATSRFMWDASQWNHNFCVFRNIIKTASIFMAARNIPGQRQLCHMPSSFCLNIFHANVCTFEKAAAKIHIHICSHNTLLSTRRNINRLQIATLGIKWWIMPSGMHVLYISPSYYFHRF